MNQFHTSYRLKKRPLAVLSIVNKTLYAVALVLSLAACTKKDPEVDPQKPEEETPSNPGAEWTTATMYELVEVKPDPARPFDRDSYQGVMDGITVELVKDEQGRLVFMVPYEVTEGTKDLRITGINDQTWTFTIKPSPLKELATPQVFVDLVAKIKDHYPVKENPDMQHIFDQLDRVMASASTQEKQKLSLYYLQHQRVLDELMFADIDEMVEQYAKIPRAMPLHTTGLMANASRQSAMSSTSSDKDTAIDIAKLSLGVLILGGGAVVVYAVPSPMEKILGLAAVYIGWKLARKYKEALDDRNIRILGFAYEKIVDGFKSQAPRVGTGAATFKMASTRAGGGGNAVEFEFDRDVTLNIQMVRRPLTLQDRDNSSYLVREYFAAYDKLETIVTKINEVIEWVNKRVTFVSYDTLPTVTLPEEAEEVHEQLPEDARQDLMLSFGHNVEVKSHSWDEDGYLVLNARPNKRYHHDKVEMVLSINYQNRYHSITQDFYVKFDMCASVQRLLDEGVNPKQLYDRWYETRCMVGKSYGGGLIGTFQNMAAAPDYCVVLTPRPVGSANYATAVQNVANYSSGGYTDWQLPGPNSNYWIAYRNLLNHYQENQTSVSTTGHIWVNHPINNGYEDYEADAYAYSVSIGGLIYQKISAQHSVWPMRIETY